MVWWTPPAEGKENITPANSVLNYHYELQSNITALIAAAEQDQLDTKSTHKALRTLQSNANGIGEYPRHQLQPKYYNERRLPESSIAIHVLRIPELLELILFNLDVRDVLNVSVTCRWLKHIIEASPKLRPNLFLAPVKSTPGKKPRWQTPFLPRSVPGFEGFIADDWPPVNGFEVLAFFDFEDERSMLPRVGSKCKDMLICQPPEHHMWVSISCRLH